MSIPTFPESKRQKLKRQGFKLPPDFPPAWWDPHSLLSYPRVPPSLGKNS
jgi:hypothetical protein